MKKILYIVLMVMWCLNHYAQNPDIKRTWHWYWGNKGGMNFSNGGMVFDSSCAGEIVEANAIISDTAGNLLFYTDGDTVWNKYHQIMLNGTGLMGHFSAYQGALIAPHPCNDSLYYIFTADQCYPSFAPCRGLRYSVVNVFSNSGQGEVISKNILLLDTCTESIGGTLHANGKNVWILAQRRRTNELYLYLIDCSTVHLQSIIAPYYATDYHLYGGSDALVFSPDGKWLAHCYYCSGNDCDTIALYKFDNTNGTLNLFYKWSLIDNINVIKGVTASIAFSTDSKFLYIGTIFPDNIHNYLYRYKLNVDYATLVNNIINKEIIYVVNDPLKEMIFCARTTPNSKIFILNDYFDTNRLWDSILVANNINTNELLYINKINNNSKNGDEINQNYGWYTFPNFISSYFDIRNKQNFIPENSSLLIIPNIFTPNADNINDYFSIQIAGYKNIEYFIYNRWGMLIHQGKKELNPELKTEEKLWDGKINKEPASDGVYYYILNLTNTKNETETKKGFVQLLR